MAHARVSKQGDAPIVGSKVFTFPRIRLRNRTKVYPRVIIEASVGKSVLVDSGEETPRLYFNHSIRRLYAKFSFTQSVLFQSRF
jgi:hypothetical protein